MQFHKIFANKLVYQRYNTIERKETQIYIDVCTFGDNFNQNKKNYFAK